LQLACATFREKPKAAKEPSSPSRLMTPKMRLITQKIQLLTPKMRLNDNLHGHHDSFKIHPTYNTDNKGKLYCHAFCRGPKGHLDKKHK